MVAWRVIGALVAAVLIGVVAMDMAAERGRSDQVLMYEKGTYLGQADTGISEDVRAQIRARGSQAAFR